MPLVINSETVQVKKKPGPADAHPGELPEIFFKNILVLTNFILDSSFFNVHSISQQQDKTRIRHYPVNDISHLL